MHLLPAQRGTCSHGAHHASCGHAVDMPALHAHLLPWHVMQPLLYFNAALADLPVDPACSFHSGCALTVPVSLQALLAGSCSKLSALCCYLKKFW